MGIESLLIISSILFCIGLFGALSRKSIIVILMSLELMFNGVNLALVAFSRFGLPAGLAVTTNAGDPSLQTVLVGQVFAMFIIAVAAAEIALGLGIVIAIYRNRETIDVTNAGLLKW